MSNQLKNINTKNLKQSTQANAEYKTNIIDRVVNKVITVVGYGLMFCALIFLGFMIWFIAMAFAK